MSEDAGSASPSLAQRLRRRAWRAFYRARHVLLEQRHLARTDRATVGGVSVIVAPGVFHPAFFFSSELLVQAVRRAPIGSASPVIDLGTGTGIAALAAAERSSHVVAVDIDPRAVACAQENVMSNGRSGRVEVRQGDLFGASAGERFDLVLFNPPWLKRPAGTPLDRAFVGPPDLGRRFAHELARHLAPRGAALLVLSTNGVDASFLGPLRDGGFALEPVLRRDRGSEVLTVWRVTAPDQRASITAR